MIDAARGNRGDPRCAGAISGDDNESDGAEHWEALKLRWKGSHRAASHGGPRRRTRRACGDGVRRMPTHWWKTACLSGLDGPAGGRLSN